MEKIEIDIACHGPSQMVFVGPIEVADGMGAILCEISDREPWRIGRFYLPLGAMIVLRDVLDYSIQEIMKPTFVDPSMS